MSDDAGDDPYNEELVEEILGDFGIRLWRPEYWESRIEDHTPRTWLFWDLDSGSLRFTPWRVEAPEFRIDAYLASVRADEDAKGNATEWRVLGDRRWVTWTQDDETTNTRSHFYATGDRDIVLVCSWAYDRDLIDDEVGSVMLDGATEHAQRCLESVQFPTN